MATQENIQLPSLREKEDDVPVITGDIMEELKILMQHSQAFQEMQMMYA